jgi:hypothetical protein
MVVLEQSTPLHRIRRQATASRNGWHGPAHPILLLGWANTARPWAGFNPTLLIDFPFYGIDYSLNTPEICLNFKNS